MERFEIPNLISETSFSYMNIVLVKIIIRIMILMLNILAILIQHSIT